MSRRNFLIGTLSALSITAGLLISPSAFIGSAAMLSAAMAYEAPAYDTQVVAAKERWAKLGFETQMIKVNGVELHVASAGSGDPIVLLHGYPQSGEIWRLIAPELAKTHKVIIPDLRGMGLSGISKDGYDLVNVAEDIHQVVTSLGVAKVKVIGHDWGAAVGGVYALRYRDEVTKLAFVESAIGGLGFEDLWTFAKPNPGFTFIPLLLSGQLTEDLIGGREDVFLKHLWTGFNANKAKATFENWQPYINAMTRPGLIQSSATYYRAIYDSSGANRALVAKGKLAIPVLSIAGQASFGDFQKGFVEAFASNIVKHVNIAGSGHFVAEEQPDALMTELRPFLEQ